MVINRNRLQNGALELTVPGWVNGQEPVTRLSKFEHATLAAITLIAAALRFIELDRAGFRIDEGFTLTVTRQSWAGVLGFHGYYDLHPPLFFSLTKMADLFVSETIAPRVVAAIAGTATIPVFYAFCRRLLDSRVALGAAAILTFSPLHIELSRDGRMYAPVVFCVCLGWLALIANMQSPTPVWAVLYGFTLILALYVDYSAVFALSPQVIVVLIYLLRARGQANWLIGSIVGAVIGYLPWLPQIYQSVSRSGYLPVRTDQLSASWEQINNSILSLLGFSGRTVTGVSDKPDAWGRLPEWHWLLIILAFLALILGLIALRRMPAVALLISMLVVAPPLAAILLSQISPAYAPRTIMASVLGISILASAFLMRGQMHRLLRAAGAAGWLYLLVVSMITLPATFSVGTQGEWPEIARDLAAQDAMGKPILVFSTAGMLTDMLDLYGGDQLENSRIITLLDGPREQRMGFGRWLDRGILLNDIREGALADLLPQGDTGVDAVWAILRFGGSRIPGYLNDIGFVQIGSFRYAHTTLYLFARPDADLGIDVPVNPEFAEVENGQDGWRIKSQGADVRAAGSNPEVVMLNDQTSATFQYSPGVDGLVSVDVEVRAPLDQAAVVLRCNSQSGESLGQTRAVSGEPSSPGVWQLIRLAALCPSGTQRVELTLQRDGPEQILFRNVKMQFNPNEPDSGN